MLIIIIIDDAVAEITEGDFYCTKRLILFIRQQVAFIIYFLQNRIKISNRQFFLVPISFFHTYKYR